MPTFDTPEPISARIEISTGDIAITASRRTDTVVDVRPTDSSNAADVKAAEGAKIDYAQGKLQIKASAQMLLWPGMSRRAGSVDVVIELPEGSHVRGSSSWVTLRGEGRLGECRFEAAQSDIRLQETGPLRLTTSRGEIHVTRVVGNAKVVNGSGGVRVEEIDGAALIGNDQGEARIGDVTGNLRLTGMNGDFHVERAHGSVEAKTAHGSIRIGEVIRGSVVVTASSAEIEIGIKEGTAAKLDVSTLSGAVRNSLKVVDGPAKSDEIVEVRVRTYSGDIVIRRS
ncbi:Putative adhesin [Streptomyces sp. yr375]|uniref:DUF4097 family beta strand repeat-containing protein n=1 Tax=Streptomyces sp. yr375 TaxID=1761906 RepID=UPI0008CFBEE2|nr:DUF4097 family beta strand repeat-containing protein [Streptomyces sp. yr375]SES47227.1 Putative adhesin [Streptomyces sp. yr375]